MNLHKPWEFLRTRHMLSLLIGSYFGPHPEKEIARIKEFKKECALFILQETGINKNDVVLEIGSGNGTISCHIAPKTKELYCCDISRSFLKLAKQECMGIENISFHHIQPGSFSFPFLQDRSVDVVFSHNVFIHLNLFDIYWYLKEISRLIKQGGKLWFDIADAESLDPADNPFFNTAVKIYKGSKGEAWPTLMKWNSKTAVTALAGHFGFKLDHFSLNKVFLFIKQ